MTVSHMRSQILGKGSGMAGFRSISPGSDRPRGESALAEIAHQAAALDLGAPVSIRVSPRARRVALRIDAAERRVELVLPRGVPAELGLRFSKTSADGSPPASGPCPARCRSSKGRSCR